MHASIGTNCGCSCPRVRTVWCSETHHSPETAPASNGSAASGSPNANTVQLPCGASRIGRVASDSPPLATEHPLRALRFHWAST